MKIALDRGHAAINPDTGWFDPGAVNGKYHEHALAQGVIDEIIKKIKNKINFFVPKPTWDTRTRYNEAIQNGCDYYLCIHINASTNASANGAECWWFRNNSKPFADQIMQNLKLFKNNGVKQKDGVLGQSIATIPYAFLELGFISNTNDLNKLLYQKEEIASNIVKTLEYFSGVKVEKRKAVFNMQGADNEKLYLYDEQDKLVEIVGISHHPVSLKGTAMIPVSSLRALGLTVTWHPETKQLEITY
ncbi:MAG TPA: N-acetylmuramoyl-L-alanine amidase [Candidatus Methanofastidiosum sp.]|nr:N-acetylmuramoyl-L-alanine amidase [Methanofastidiosum sp.]